MWSILDNILCALKKNVYTVVGRNVLEMSVKSGWLMVLFSYLSSFSILHSYCIIECGILKWLFLNICVSPAKTITFCFMYFRTLLLGCIYAYICYVLLIDWPFFKIIIKMSFFISSNSFCLKIYFVWITTDAPVVF